MFKKLISSEKKDSQKGNVMPEHNNKGTPSKNLDLSISLKQTHCEAALY